MSLNDKHHIDHLTEWDVEQIDDPGDKIRLLTVIAYGIWAGWPVLLVSNGALVAAWVTFWTVGAAIALCLLADPHKPPTN